MTDTGIITELSLIVECCSPINNPAFDRPNASNDYIADY